MRTNQNGFTMMELIIVIVIIGILSAIAVPKYFDLTAGAEDAANDANIKAIEAAILLEFSSQLMDDASTDLSDIVDDYNDNADSFFLNGVAPAGLEATISEDGTTFSVGAAD